MAGIVKPLIVKGRITVAEERQVRRLVTQANNKTKRHKACRLSKRGKKITLRVSRSRGAMEPYAALTRVVIEKTQTRCLFDIVRCRAFETLHRGLSLSYNWKQFAPGLQSNTPSKLIAVCDCVNGTTDGSRRTLPC
jgi:hypothetical protein